MIDLPIQISNHIPIDILFDRIIWNIGNLMSLEMVE